MHWKEKVQDAVEQLKTEREHANEPARVLEAIICGCAEIAASVEGWGIPQLVDLANQLKESAIKLYAAASPNPVYVRNLLESTIGAIEPYVLSGAPT